MKKEYRELISGFIRKRIFAAGFERIRVSEICTGLGISKKTVYKYFPSKEYLLESVIKEELLTAYTALVLLLQEKSSMATKVKKLSAIIKVHILLFNDESLPKLKREHAKIWKEVLRFRNQQVMPLINLLINHSKKHHIIIDYPNELIIRLFSTSLSISAGRKYSLHSKNEFKSVYDKIFEILLNGILTKKGKKLITINKRMENEND